MTGAAADDVTASSAGTLRRPEPSFARAVRTPLGDARAVLDVRSDGPSYAPDGPAVTTVRTADDLPFPDGAFDTALCSFPGVVGVERTLAEIRRVTDGPVVVLTRDPARVPDSWLAEYAPEVVAAQARRHPALDRIAAALPDDTVTTTPLAIPFTCVDGSTEAYYGRPERLLDPAVRRADPAWGAVDELSVRRSVAALRAALESGDWDARHGRLRVQPSWEGSLVLLVARPRG